jgi:exopolysaccharide production protein ExoZ
MNSSMRRIEQVQALRFVAALSVVVFHLTFLFYDVPSIRYLAWARHVGWAGVDVFFVISGFIIYSVTQRIDWSMGVPRVTLMFLARRLMRIYPIYWFWFAVFAAFVAVGAPAAFHNHWDLENWVHRALLLQWLDNKLVPVAWTLTFEMFFYCIFAAALLFGRYNRVVLVLWIAAEIVVSVTNHFLPGDAAPGSWRWAAWANPIVLEFAMGCGVATLVTSGFRRFSVVAGVAWLPLFFLGAYVSANNTAVGLGAVDFRVITFGLGSALLVYALCSWEVASGSMAPAWMVLLGDASYSLYLCQEAPLYVVRYAFEVAGAKQWLWGVPALLTAIAAVIAVGLASYRYLERPIMAAAASGLGTSPPST